MVLAVVHSEVAVAACLDSPVNYFFPEVTTWIEQIENLVDSGQLADATGRRVISEYYARKREEPKKPGMNKVLSTVLNFLVKQEEVTEEEKHLIQSVCPPNENLAQKSERQARKAEQEYCGGCAIRERCLRDALDNDLQGIWAGTTEEDRRLIKRRNIGFMNPAKSA